MLLVQYLCVSSSIDTRAPFRSVSQERIGKCPFSCFDNKGHVAQPYPVLHANRNRTRSGLRCTPPQTQVYIWADQGLQYAGSNDLRQLSLFRGPSKMFLHALHAGGLWGWGQSFRDMNSRLRFSPGISERCCWVFLQPLAEAREWKA